jgi:hypothetical protein
MIPVFMEKQPLALSLWLLALDAALSELYQAENEMLVRSGTRIENKNAAISRWLKAKGQRLRAKGQC